MNSFLSEGFSSNEFEKVPDVSVFELEISLFNLLYSDWTSSTAAGSNLENNNDICKHPVKPVL